MSHGVYISDDATSLHYRAVMRFGQAPCPHKGWQEFAAINKVTGEVAGTMWRQTLAAHCGECMDEAKAVIQAEIDDAKQDARIETLEEEIAPLRREGGPGRGNTAEEQM